MEKGLQLVGSSQCSGHLQGCFVVLGRLNMKQNLSIIFSVYPLLWAELHAFQLPGGFPLKSTEQLHRKSTGSHCKKNRWTSLFSKRKPLVLWLVRAYGRRFSGPRGVLPLLPSRRSARGRTKHSRSGSGSRELGWKMPWYSLGFPVPFYRVTVSFLGEGSPTTIIDYRKKGTLILTSLLEDRVAVFH